MVKEREYLGRFDHSIGSFFEAFARIVLSPYSNHQKKIQPVSSGKFFLDRRQFENFFGHSLRATFQKLAKCYIISANLSNLKKEGTT
jgi:hypothetical protein